MQLAKDRQRVRRWRLRSQHREQLLQDDDHPDAAHESGDNRVGNVADVGADPEQPQSDLQQTGENNNPRDGRKVDSAGRKNVRCHDARHDQRHRPRRASDLHGRAPKHRRDDASGDGAVKARRWPQSGSDAKGKRQRQRDDAGRYATEDIAACDVPGKRGGPRISGRAHGFAFSSGGRNLTRPVSIS